MALVTGCLICPMPEELYSDKALDRKKKYIHKGPAYSRIINLETICKNEQAFF